MNFIKFFYKYNHWILAIIIIGNTALFFEFLVENGLTKESNKTYVNRLTKAFKQEKFHKEIYHYKLQVNQFASFLQKHTDALLLYHIQKDFKLVQKNDGGYFIYKKTKDIFHFYNQKGMYVYIPPHLRDSVRYFFSQFKDGLITGFTLESSRLHHSLDNKKCNIVFRLKYHNKDFPNNISHAIYVNKKYKISSKARTEGGDLLLKDALFDKDKYYVIRAFISIER